jgi:hypothetical protein
MSLLRKRMGQRRARARVKYQRSDWPSESKMRIYIFKSEVNRAIRAFAGDLAGTKLPDQFKPWHAVGVVGPDRKPPFDLSREVIEKAINAQGFQLWRMKPAAERA